MQDIRCGQCNRKLAEGQIITIKIKCPRCHTLNSLSATRAEPERHRASPPRANHEQQSHHSVAGRQAPPG
ncbi:Com family DNA-binding transcriptional regulator [Craterilacuibacter sinensis]|uniref:Com family DNA-binding transcriptional regulator n=1 Tax=Craterilacuibacter sinensis TaxID=2686017 RepID=A0A845BTU2_9NEIS|nr:Com family DNA-binding transcriptional regulator [Craterilacuibacter sinensis]MXR38011.1 Com family DNA-binding transcriptional regulator [Craterilacuibacter sinensis]